MIIDGKAPLSTPPPGRPTWCLHPHPWGHRGHVGEAFEKRHYILQKNFPQDITNHLAANSGRLENINVVAIQQVMKKWWREDPRVTEYVSRLFLPVLKTVDHMRAE